jgi:TetR/AcrR family acrAB operon transcriptional repressor
MVRKTREAALATREALIDAAERAFRRSGVTRTSLADVAAEAGMTRGAIYWHFRDKVKLLDAMCERTTMPMDAALAEAAGGAPADPLGTLRTLAVDALQRLARDPHTHAVFEILFHKCELTGVLAKRNAERVQSRAQCLHGVTQLMRLAVERGQLPADADATLAARLVHGGIVGLMHDWAAASHEYDLAAAAPALVEALVAGIRAAPPRRTATSPQTVRAATAAGG